MVPALVDEPRCSAGAETGIDGTRYLRHRKWHRQYLIRRPHLPPPVHHVRPPVLDSFPPPGISPRLRARPARLAPASRPMAELPPTSDVPAPRQHPPRRFARFAVPGTIPPGPAAARNRRGKDECPSVSLSLAPAPWVAMSD